MSSQTDLDQGGTFRQLARVYMGPSLGWRESAAYVILPVTVAGTTQVQIGNSLVTLNVNGLVTLQLPSAKGNTAGAGAVPGTWIPTPITIADIGGFSSGVNAAIILPFAGETIDGLAQITLDSPFGAYVLRPKLETGSWTLTQ